MDFFFDLKSECLNQQVETKALAFLPLIAASVFLSACSENVDNWQDRRGDEDLVGGNKRECKQDERAAG